VSTTTALALSGLRAFSRRRFIRTDNTPSKFRTQRKPVDATPIGEWKKSRDHVLVPLMGGSRWKWWRNFAGEVGGFGIATVRVSGLLVVEV
jgi:hypothetical protein